MAENQPDTSQERTEEPTPKRRQDARNKGDVARSRELNTAAILVVGALGLLMFGAKLANSMAGVFRFNFDIPREHAFDTNMMMAYFGESIIASLWALFPLFMMLLIAALLAPIALGGWVISGEALAPKLNRMSPLQGL